MNSERFSFKVVNETKALLQFIVNLVIVVVLLSNGAHVYNNFSLFRYLHLFILTNVLWRDQGLNADIIKILKEFYKNSTAYVKLYLLGEEFKLGRGV